MKTKLLSKTILLALAIGLGVSQPLVAAGVRADSPPTGVKSSDWQSISQAYQAHRHRFAQTPDGSGHHLTRQHRGKYSARFDGRGFLMAPDVQAGQQAPWSWGLDLQAYGIAGPSIKLPPRPLAASSRSTPRHNLLHYQHSAALTEWYHNKPEGLEHGWTLKTRPAGDAKAPLTLLLSVRGGLLPKGGGDPQSLTFCDKSGTKILDYAGLKAWDSRGRALSSWFVRPTGTNLITLQVDDRGAAYPVTIDPTVTLEAELSETSPAAGLIDAGDRFGFSVAIQGDLAVVGAPFEDSAARSINGNGGDNSSSDSGAVYVFERDASGIWQLEAYLKASNADAYDNFGYAIAVDQDTVAVGAPGEDGASGSIDHPEDNSVLESGAVYVFKRDSNSGQWAQVAYLKSLQNQSGAALGRCVALQGGNLLAGAPYQDVAVAATTSEPASILENAGRVQSFQFATETGRWQPLNELLAEHPTFGANFGVAIALDDKTAAIGSPNEGNGLDASGNVVRGAAINSGSVHVFAARITDDGLNQWVGWDQAAYLKAPNYEAGDLFGSSVAISGATLLVGAPNEDSSGTGGSVNLNNNSAPDSGAVYVFAYNSGAGRWSPSSAFKASNSAAGLTFGTAVACVGNLWVASAPQESSASSGINGSNTLGGSTAAGAVYIYSSDTGGITLQAYLKAATSMAYATYGNAIALDGDNLLIGSSLFNDGIAGPASGAVYAYSKASGVWTYVSEHGDMIDGPNASLSLDVGDGFGTAVAVSGDTVAIGAPFEDSAGIGVNPGVYDNNAVDSGAVYVFVRNAINATWSLQAFIKSSNSDAGDNFGNAVSISGDTLAVAAKWESSNAKGVNPLSDPLTGNGQYNNSLHGAGAAYVFVRSAGNWTQQAYFKESNTYYDEDNFGQSIACSGDTVVVSSHRETSNATGVNPPGDPVSATGQFNHTVGNAGAVYVFVRTAGIWAQQAYIKASNTGRNDYFGFCVALDGDTLAVSATGESSSASGVNPASDLQAGTGQYNNNLTDAGAAYVFVRNAGVWTQQAYLKASNPDYRDRFGVSIAVNADLLVVGSPYESSAASGVNVISDQAAGTGQFDNSLQWSGAAYVFARSAGVWSQQAYLKASNTGLGDFFGISVGVSGQVVVVGASVERSLARGINPVSDPLARTGQYDDSRWAVGAAYAYGLNASQWSQFAYIKGSHPAGNDFFGHVLCLDGQRLVVGQLANGQGQDPEGEAHVFTITP